jgi:hypothetical protein
MANPAFIGSQAFSAAGGSETRVSGGSGLQQLQADYDGNGTVGMAIDIILVGLPLTDRNFSCVTAYDF